MPDVIALSLVADLSLSVQVEEAARHLGFRVATVSTPDKAIATLRHGRASFFVMELTVAGDRVGEVVRAAKAAPYPVAVLAFGPQTEVQAHQAAVDAGADLVVPTGEFNRQPAQSMIACLDRHRESQARSGQDPG
jgi:DNA-binding response OmpR family regulator